MIEANMNIYNRLHDIVLNPNKYLPDECENAFLLLRFYKNPTDILGNENNPTPEQYQNIVDYDKLFLNNDFISLVEHGLKDEKFMGKVSIQILRKINFFCFDGVECKKEYIPDVQNKDDEALGKFKAAKSKAFDICRKALVEVAVLGRDLKYSKDDEKPVNKFDKEAAYSLRIKLSNEIDDLYQLTEGRAREKEHILSLVEEQYYKEGEDNDLYLEMYSIHAGIEYDRDFVTSLVLENRFTDIVNKLLEADGLSKLMICNIIMILTLGIRIKKHQLSDFEFYLCNLFSKEEIQSFDINKAEQTISLLQMKQQKAGTPVVLKLVQNQKPTSL